MKQDITSPIPKSDEVPLLIDTWRAVTLLTIDYEILALVTD